MASSDINAFSRLFLSGVGVPFLGDLDYASKAATAWELEE
jgi:hypothetical protein